VRITLVQRSLIQRSFRRRLIALAAAYAIALSGLFASFGAAQAAALAAADPGGFICHGAPTDQSAPSPGESNGKLCIDCCTGCLMLMAALPPPPATTVALVQSAGVVQHPTVVVALAGTPETKSHRSRAPPFGA